MAYSDAGFRDYAYSLYSASSFDQAFAAFETVVSRIGFDGVLYTFIPRLMLDSGFHVPPVYQVSREYSAEYLTHYRQACFEKSDPLIRAVQCGVDHPVDWWGDVCHGYRSLCPRANEVIESARNYGIVNGVTVPLMSDHIGISGASFISSEGPKYDCLLRDSISSLQLCSRMFHNLVLSSAPHRNGFVKPLLEVLSDTERLYLAGLAAGKSSAQLALELNRSVGYLEQLMIRLRRKFSGGRASTINRNQLLYYAGLLEILDK